jgi:predicted nucleic acid-binding protein
LIYLDSSALIKLVRPEQETAALERFLHTHSRRPHVASELVVTEVLRSLIRQQAPKEQFETAHELLGQLTLLPVSRRVLEHAAVIPHQSLRSLDAVHVASAQRLRSALLALVTYDERMIMAAVTAKVPSESPA